MENRSFDHILGWFTSTRPKTDGLTGKESNRLSVSDPTSPKVHVTDDAYFIDSDPGHSFQAIPEQIFDRWFASVLASTQPNRLYVHSATSHGATASPRKPRLGSPKHSRDWLTQALRLANSSAATD